MRGKKESTLKIKKIQRGWRHCARKSEWGCIACFTRIEVIITKTNDQINGGAFKCLDSYKLKMMKGHEDQEIDDLKKFKKLKDYAYFKLFDYYFWSSSYLVNWLLDLFNYVICNLVEGLFFDSESLNFVYLF